MRAFEDRISNSEDIADAGEPKDLTGLAQDLQAAREAPQSSVRLRRQLIGTLIEDIVADIDEATVEIFPVVHWTGGRPTELRSMAARSGEHGACTGEDALAIIREMTGRWPDDAIAAPLNRLAIRTGQGKTWTAKRVSSIRRVNDTHGYLSADREGPWRTMTEAAPKPGVTSHVIGLLIKDGILPANQLVAGAPWRCCTKRFEG